MPRFLIEITPLDPGSTLQGPASIVVELRALDWSRQIVERLRLAGAVVETVGGEKP